MYPICYQWVSGGYLQPEPTMYSRCFCWFPGPLAPSDFLLVGESSLVPDPPLPPPFQDDPLPLSPIYPLSCPQPGIDSPHHTTWSPDATFLIGWRFIIWPRFVSPSSLLVHSPSFSTHSTLSVFPIRLSSYSTIPHPPLTPHFLLVSESSLPSFSSAFIH